MLQINTKAPDFILKDQNGKDVSLSDFLGKKVILYFYPKDNTSGCTKQACSFNELLPLFVEKDAVIIGVSKDSVASHKKFADKFNLKFTILADPDKEVLNMYEVYKTKIMYGKEVMGTVRSTYLIDEKGMIVKAMEKVNASENANDMLKAVSGDENA